MAAKERVRDVDGLSLVRAVRHAHEAGHERKPQAPSVPEPPPDVPADDAKAKAAKIGRTAIPTRHEIFCYACGYEFHSAGKTRTLYCPKCRKILDQVDYTIATEAPAEIRTTGNVRVAPEGVVTGGVIVARDLIVEGRLDRGEAKVSRRLELAKGAVFDLSRITTPDLRIAEGADIELAAPVTFRNVEVLGVLRADLIVTGMLAVHAGGCFHGRVRGQHLHVEEGAGLCAEIAVDPSSPVPGAPAAEKPVARRKVGGAR